MKDRNKDRTTPLSDRGALAPEEVATYLSLSRAKVYELLRSGDLPSFHIGKSRRVRVGALLDWIRDREQDELR